MTRKREYKQEYVTSKKVVASGVVSRLVDSYDDPRREPLEAAFRKMNIDELRMVATALRKRGLEPYEWEDE